MRYIVSVMATLVVLSLGGIALGNSKGIPSWVADKMVSNVYAITTNVEVKRREGIGTGFWLDEWYLITNCHVTRAFRSDTFREGVRYVKYSRILAIKHDQSRVFEMEVIACDETRDLSILRAKWPNHEAEKLDVEWRQPRLGQIMYSAGYQQNMPLAPKVGYAGKLQYPYGPGTGVRMGLNMPIAPGDSGSPVFDKWGNIRGVVSAVFGASNYRGRVIPIANISIGIPALSLTTLLEEYGYDSTKGD